jgi:hypothetical protein
VGVGTVVHQSSGSSLSSHALYPCPYPCPYPYPYPYPYPNPYPNPNPNPHRVPERGVLPQQPRARPEE